MVDYIEFIYRNCKIIKTFQKLLLILLGTFLFFGKKCDKVSVKKFDKISLPLLTIKNELKYLIHCYKLVV